MILQSDYPKPTTNPSATNQVTPKKQIVNQSINIMSPKKKNIQPINQ